MADAASQARFDAAVRWRHYVDSIAAGDARALGQLYDESSALVYTVAVRILKDTADAEEVALDVYAHVWRGARSYSDGRGTVAAWLVMLARSRAIDRLRSTGAKRRSEAKTERQLPAAADLESTYADTQRRRKVENALAQLPREQKELVELAFYSGYSHSELADRQQLPLGTVKTRIRTALQRLRDLLEDVDT